jgi:hypothetical protein
VVILTFLFAWTLSTWAQSQEYKACQQYWRDHNLEMEIAIALAGGTAGAFAGYLVSPGPRENPGSELLARQARELHASAVQLRAAYADYYKYYDQKNLKNVFSERLEPAQRNYLRQIRNFQTTAKGQPFLDIRTMLADLNSSLLLAHSDQLDKEAYDKISQTVESFDKDLTQSCEIKLTAEKIQLLPWKQILYTSGGAGLGGLMGWALAHNLNPAGWFAMLLCDPERSEASPPSLSATPLPRPRPQPASPKQPEPKQPPPAPAPAVHELDRL